MRRFLALAAVLAACSKIPTVSQFPDIVTVALGSEFRITTPELTVRFVEVMQDSRCPIGATCVQPGSATLRFSLLSTGGGVTALVLETDQPAQTSQGVRFRLVSVEPVPRIGVPPDARRYRATLEVSTPGS